MNRDKLEKKIAELKSGNKRAFDYIYEHTNRSVYFAIRPRQDVCRGHFTGYIHSGNLRAESISDGDEFLCLDMQNRKIACAQSPEKISAGNSHGF